MTHTLYILISGSTVPIIRGIAPIGNIVLPDFWKDLTQYKIQWSNLTQQHSNRWHDIVLWSFAELPCPSECQTGHDTGVIGLHGLEKVIYKGKRSWLMYCDNHDAGLADNVLTMMFQAALPRRIVTGILTTRKDILSGNIVTIETNDTVIVPRFDVSPMIPLTNPLQNKDAAWYLDNDISRRQIYTLQNITDTTLTHF